MSFVVATPEALAAASRNLTGIGAAITKAHAAAAAPTTSVVAAARDEVSAAIAELFGSHGQAYQAVAGRAAAFHDEFVANLGATGTSYAATDAANADPAYFSKRSLVSPFITPQEQRIVATLYRRGAHLRQLTVSEARESLGEADYELANARNLWESQGIKRPE